MLSVIPMIYFPTRSIFYIGNQRHFVSLLLEMIPNVLNIPSELDFFGFTNDEEERS